MNTTNNNIPYVPENTVDPAAGLNDAIRVIDALLQCEVKGFVDQLPTSANDGDLYIDNTNKQLCQFVAQGSFWNRYNAKMVIHDGAIYLLHGGQWRKVSL